MKQEFSVSSNNFSLYEAFRKEMEVIGYTYADKFSKFTEHDGYDRSCLYFSDEFEDDYTPNGMALSNPDNEVRFYLPEGWCDAIEFAKLNYSEVRRRNDLVTTVSMDEVFDILSKHFKTEHNRIAITN